MNFIFIFCFVKTLESNQSTKMPFCYLFYFSEFLFSFVFLFSSHKNGYWKKVYSKKKKKKVFLYHNLFGVSFFLFV